MRINTVCHASDDATAYYEQQKRRAVKIVVDKLTGDPAAPLTKILRSMAGMKSPEIHSTTDQHKDAPPCREKPPHSGGMVIRPAWNMVQEISEGLPSAPILYHYL